MSEKFEINKSENCVRLDNFLEQQIDELTRSGIKNQIDDGNVMLNGKLAKAGKLLKLGDIVEIDIKPTENFDNVQPQNIPIEIIYEDDDMAIINKPQGMTVHPAPGNPDKTLVNAMLYHFDKISDVSGRIRPGIVHRIDKDTSGLLVVAKNNQAHVCLAEQIATKTCKRTYLAVVEGVVKQDSGTIDEPIGRDHKDRKKMAVTTDGRQAITHYKVLERYKENTLVQFDLQTGRTHQIRVHSKYIGHPIVGDKTYGYTKQKFNLNGQLLHATRLKLLQPTTKAPMEFNAPVPDYFDKVIKLLQKTAQ